MSKRRRIADFYPFEPRPDVIVGDDEGNSAPAALDRDCGWMDVSDPERPRELRFMPRWYEIVPSGKSSLAVPLAPRALLPRREPPQKTRTGRPSSKSRSARSE